MAGKTLIWNGVSSDGLNGVIVGEIRRSIIGRPRTTILEIAGRAGFYTFPQERGSRLITAEISVSTAKGSAHDAAMEQFADWLDIEAEAKLKIGSGSDRFYLGVVRDSPEPSEWNGLSQFLVTWEVQPYSFADALEQELWNGASPLANTWDAGVGTPVRPVIVIRPTNGTLTGFTLSANDYDLTVDGIVVASGDDITVNSVVPVVLYGPNDDVELTGAYDPTDVVMAGTSGEFPWIIPGASNTITFTKTGGTATLFNITTSYRTTFRR